MLPTSFYVLIILLVLGLIGIYLLYFYNVGPYGQTYQFRDLRTWQPVSDNFAWLTPTTQAQSVYGNTNRNVPDPMIKNVYCTYDPNRCTPDQATFSTFPIAPFC